MIQPHPELVLKSSYYSLFSLTADFLHSADSHNPDLDTLFDLHKSIENLGENEKEVLHIGMFLRVGRLWKLYNP